MEEFHLNFAYGFLSTPRCVSVKMIPVRWLIWPPDGHLNWYPDNIPSGQNPLCSFLHRWTKSPSCFLQGGHNPLWNFLQDGHNPPRDFYKVDKIPSIRWTKSPSDKTPLADYCHRNGTRMVDETVSIGHTLCSLKTDRINLKRSFLYIIYTFFLWIMFYPNTTQNHRIIVFLVNLLIICSTCHLVNSFTATGNNSGLLQTA